MAPPKHAVITIATARRLLEAYRGEKMNVRSKLRGFESWWSGSATIFKYVSKLIEDHGGEFPTSNMDSIWRVIHNEPFNTARTHLSYLTTFLNRLSPSFRERLNWGEHESWSNVQKQNELFGKTYLEQSNTRYHEGELNAAEKKLYLSWGRIKSGVENYSATNARAMTSAAKDTVVTLHKRWNYLSGLLYTNTDDGDGGMMGPRRSEVVSVITEKPTPDDGISNYLDLDTGVAVLRTYKTSRLYGDYHLPLNVETIALIRLIISSQTYKNTMGPSRHLFKYHAENYSSVLSKAFQAMCGRALSVRILRKSFVDYAKNHGYMSTWADIERLAKSMGNTALVLSKNYTLRSPEADADTPEEDENDLRTAEDYQRSRVFEGEEDSSDSDSLHLNSDSDSSQLSSDDDSPQPHVGLGGRRLGPVGSFDSDDSDDDVVVETTSETIRRRRKYVSVQQDSDVYKTLQEIAPRYKNVKPRPWARILKSRDIMEHNGKTIQENLINFLPDGLNSKQRSDTINNIIARIPEWSSEANVEEYRRQRRDTAAEHRRRQKESQSADSSSEEV